MANFRWKLTRKVRHRQAYHPPYCLVIVTYPINHGEWTSEEESMQVRWGVVILVTLALSSFGCPFPGGGGTGPDPDPLEQQRLDIQHYNDLTVELDAARTEFGGEVIGEMYPAGNVIYWLEYRAWDPTIHSLDTVSGRRVNYAVPLSFDTLNVRVSESALAYAEDGGDEIIYHVFDATQEEAEITTAVFEAPTDEQRWWAYAVSGTDLYVLVTESEASPGTKLFRVSAGGEPVLVTTLEEAGCDVGEFWDFGVAGGTMIFIESGRIWSLDLPSNQATWLHNETEISFGSTIEFTHDGVLFTTATGPFFFDYETASLTDLAEAIAATDYQLSETFSSSHLYNEDMTRWRDYFIYVGNSGLFAFNPAQSEIVPILLEPRMGETSDVRVDYRYPVVLDNGTLFVTALESESGATGADGPIYQVDLANILP